MNNYGLLVANRKNYRGSERTNHRSRKDYPRKVQVAKSPQIVAGYMLDHPITVVLNVFDTSKNNGLKVYKFMGIQTQEEHIGHIKQSKSDRFQDR